MTLFFEGLGWKPIFADVAISENHEAAHARSRGRSNRKVESQAEARKDQLKKQLKLSSQFLVAPLAFKKDGLV